MYLQFLGIGHVWGAEHQVMSWICRCVQTWTCRPLSPIEDAQLSSRLSESLSHEGPATCRAKPMLDLANLYSRPCTLALYTVIDKCPFGAQTEPTRGSVQGLWTDRQ